MGVSITPVRLIYYATPAIMTIMEKNLKSNDCQPEVEGNSVRHTEKAGADTRINTGAYDANCTYLLSPQRAKVGLRAEILRTPENKAQGWDAGKAPKRRALNLRRLRLANLPRRALFVDSASPRQPAIRKRTDYKDGGFAARVARKLRFETTTRTRVAGWKPYVRKEREITRRERVGSAALLLERVDSGYGPAEDSESEFGLYDRMNHVTGIHA